MEKQWEKYLFHHDAIVPVKFKKNKELEPLTILIVSKRKNGRPVISHVGSILDASLRNPTSDLRLERRWKKVAKGVKDDLAEYRQGSSESRDGTHIKVSGKDSVVESFTASTGILGRLSIMLHAGANRSSSLFCNLRHIQEVSVKTDCLNSVFDAKSPLWKPNVAQFNVHKHILSKDSNYMMWVVTGIFKASKLVIATSQDNALEADVNVSAAVGDMTGLLGKAGLACFRRRDKFAVIEAPDGEPPFTYGFRALRLEYDEHGTLKGKDNDMGEDAPIVRGDDGDDESPLIEDRAYHMGAFFANGPGTDDVASHSEATDDLVCLEWDDEDDEDPDLVFTEFS